MFLQSFCLSLSVHGCHPSPPLPARPLLPVPKPAAAQCAAESGGCCGCPWKASSYVKLLALLLVVGGLVFLIIYYYPEINKFAGNGGTLQTFVKKIGFWGYVAGLPYLFGWIVVVMAG